MMLALLPSPELEIQVVLPRRGVEEQGPTLGYQQSEKITSYNGVQLRAGRGSRDEMDAKGDGKPADHRFLSGSSADGTEAAASGGAAWGLPRTPPGAAVNVLQTALCSALSGQRRCLTLGRSGQLHAWADHLGRHSHEGESALVNLSPRRISLTIHLCGWMGT